MLDHLPDRLQHSHLLLIGDGELGEWVRREAEKRPNLTWLPYSESSSRLAEMYSAADLFIHPGKWETFGIVSLEAQACGCRVIGIAGGGLEESLDGESPLILARAATGPAIAEAIIRALDLGETETERKIAGARTAEHSRSQTTFVQIDRPLPAPDRRSDGRHLQSPNPQEPWRARSGPTNLKIGRPCGSICCDTGFRGNPIDPCFRDRELFADFFTSYYTDYEPESATVAVDQESGEVVGYLLGSLRYRYCPFRQLLIMLTRVIPRALFRYLTFQYNKESRRFLYWVVFRSAAQTPKAPPRAAHYHINLRPQYRTGPDVRGLMFRFWREAKERGARAIYGQMQITG